MSDSPHVFIRGRRYRILDQLGWGGRSRSLAWDCGSRCRRLILRLVADRPSADRPDADRAARQHLHVLRRLPQRGAVPQIIDWQQRGDELWVVLTWTEGVDLADYLQRVKRGSVVPPSVEEAIRLIRGLVHGLRTLHHHTQLIHGDLKPSNLILTRKPAHLALIDFGSAWPVERTTVREAGDGASVVYAAPEWWDKNEKADERADQFSVSVLLFELLTGVVPYGGLGGQAGQAAFRSRFDGESPAPSEHSASLQRLPRGLRRQLERVVVTGLQLDPGDRYPTTSAWLDAIEAIFLALKLEHHQVNPSRWRRFVDVLSDTLATS